jgi:hypothetical protein
MICCEKGGGENCIFASSRMFTVTQGKFNFEEIFINKCGLTGSVWLEDLHM